MPPIRNFGLLTVVRQDTEGTAETDATGGYSMPITGGMLGPGAEFGDLPRTGYSMARQGRYKQRINTSGTVSVLAHPEALGLLLYLVMGTELALGAPVGGLTPHTFVMADAWPQYSTVWASLGSGSDADVWRFRDAYLTRLRINGQSGGNFAVDLDWVSKHYTKPALGAAGFPTNYNAAGVLMGAEPRFKYIGSTIRLDSDSATPTIMDNAEMVEWEIDRNPEIRFGPSLTPTTIAPDRLVNFNAEVMYSTGSGGTGPTAFDRRAWEFLEDAYLSAINGDPDQVTPTGSFDIETGAHPDNSATLRLVSGGGAGLPTTVAVQQNWEYGVNRPEASETPTLVTYRLDGIVRAPAAGTTETTVVLGNTKATKYDA
jgi:hypothetical protein